MQIGLESERASVVMPKPYMWIFTFPSTRLMRTLRAPKDSGRRCGPGDRSRAFMCDPVGGEMVLGPANTYSKEVSL